MSETSSLEAPSIQTDDLGTNAVGLERRLLIAMSGGVFLAASWIGSILGSNALVSQFPAAIGSIILVIPLLIGAWGEISRGRPSSDSLASLAVPQQRFLPKPYIRAVSQLCNFALPL